MYKLTKDLHILNIPYTSHEWRLLSKKMWIENPNTTSLWVKIKNCVFHSRYLKNSPYCQNIIQLKIIVVHAMSHVVYNKQETIIFLDKINNKKNCKPHFDN